MPEARIVLGFDYGKRRMGIAVGSTIAERARPLQVLEHRHGMPDWPRLDALLQEWQPDALIVGLPLDVDGQSQKMTRRARNFSQEIWGRYRIPVHTVDERYTTIEANERLQQARASGSRGRRVARGDVDAMAAQVILERWLIGSLADKGQWSSATPDT